MKKIIAFLLCFNMVLAACSCGGSSCGGKDRSDKEQTDGEIGENEEVIKEENKYYDIQHLESGKDRYIIYGQKGNIALIEETDRPLEISMISDSVVEICTDKGTDSEVREYYDTVNDRFSCEYKYVAAVSGDLIAYVAEDQDAKHTLIVRDMFDEYVFYKSFEFDFAPGVSNPIKSASFTEGEKELELVYFSERSAIELEATLLIRANFYDYDSIIALYREITEVCRDHVDIPNAARMLAARLGMVSDDEIYELTELMNFAYPVYRGRGKDDFQLPHYKLSCGYAIKDLNGDGVDELVLLDDSYEIVAIFSMSEGKPILLCGYVSNGIVWIDGDGLIYELVVEGNIDAPVYKIRSIAEGGGELKLEQEFGFDRYNWYSGEPVAEYYALENGKKISIDESTYNALAAQYGKYLGRYSGKKVTEKYSGLMFTPLFTEGEIAMETLEATINGEIEVYDTYAGEYRYLRVCTAPYDRTPLCESEELEYGYIDMDGDGRAELVLDCGASGFLVLRYFGGTVFAYPFTFREMTVLNSDGTYSWNSGGAVPDYGENRLVFDGAKVKKQEIWKIVGDNECYIDGKNVTSEELTKYIEGNPKTEAELSPLELYWEKTVTPEEAVRIANEFWRRIDGLRDGAAGTLFIFRVEMSEEPSPEDEFYHIICYSDRYTTAYENWENMPPSSTDRFKEVLVNIYTGKLKPYSSDKG